MEKINKLEEKTILITSTLIVFIMMLLSKELIYQINGYTYTNSSSFTKLLLEIPYYILTISLTTIFYINNRKKDKETLTKYLKNCIIGITSITIYSLISLLESFILYMLKIDPINMSTLAKTIYLITFETFTVGILIILNKRIIKDFKKFIKNIKNYMNEYLKYWVLALTIMIFSNIIISLISPNSIPGNEASIRAIFKTSPVYIIFSSIIFAPIVEEIIFRLSIKNIIENKLVFIITSGLIFGGLHVIGNINTLTDILYIIPYGTPGIIFAYTLVKSDNICVPISLHLIHNTLMIILQLVSMFILK